MDELFFAHLSKDRMKDEPLIFTTIKLYEIIPLPSRISPEITEIAHQMAKETLCFCTGYNMSFSFGSKFSCV